MKMAVLLFFAAVQFACADLFSDPAVAEVRALHDACIDAGKDAVTDAERVILAHLEQKPGDPMLRVYLGSLLTIKSGKAFPGPSKLKYLKEGIAMMDTAVAESQGAPEVRFVRAVNNYMLPAFVRRRDEARADFLVLVNSIGDPEVAKKFSPDTLQAIYYFAGLSFKSEKETEQAQKAWEAGLALPVSGEIAQKISRELKKISRS